MSRGPIRLPGIQYPVFAIKCICVYIYIYIYIYIYSTASGKHTIGIVIRVSGPRDRDGIRNPKQ